MRKDLNGRLIIREALHVTVLVQIGSYGLMYRINQLPQDKAVNIMLSLTLWAICLIDLWFVLLVPDPPNQESDVEKIVKDRKNGFVLGVAGTVVILVIFLMQIITGSIIPFA